MGKEEIKKFLAYMPVTKTSTGKLLGILSDSSIDRDDEFMSKNLLETWAVENKTLKALANHENKMSSWVGGWTNLHIKSKGGKTALVAEPWFFDKETNPLADQIRKQVEFALSKGLNAGISIGAIPHGEMVTREIEGKEYKGFDSAELLEATWVPIQSNRNSFAEIAKSFDIDINKEENSKMVEKDLNPEGEPIADPIVEEPEVVVDVPVEEVKEEAPAKEEVKEEVAEAPVEEPQETVNDTKEVEAELVKVKKELEELKTKAVNLPTEEGPSAHIEVEKEVENPGFVEFYKLTKGIKGGKQ